MSIGRTVKSVPDRATLNWAEAPCLQTGVAYDTAEFAGESIRHWWYSMGQPLYPKSQHLLITADCGGSNGYSATDVSASFQDLLAVAQTLQASITKFKVQ